jgi:RsiW-degrading membrane proteinase PrsW (M82 family)
VLDALRWLVPALVPAVLAIVVVYLGDKEREPPWLVALTFVFGAVLALLAFVVEARAAAWTGLDVRASVAGQAGSLLFLFALVAPLREAAKVAACWPAFRSPYFDEAYDGLVYASAAVLGFAATENAVLLRANDEGWLGVARAVLALPAHVFFGCLWGYALGRAKSAKQPGPIFPVAWISAVVGHGFYTHFVYGRGGAALVAAVALVLPMLAISVLVARDLRKRGPLSSRLSLLGIGPLSFDYPSQPPSLRAMREALRRKNQPVALRWVLLGAAVTLGAMVCGLSAAIAFGHYAGVDFAAVDEHDVSTAAPVALLGSGLLSAFPLSGFLVAKASGHVGLLEPALASASAILVSLLLLGLAAPVGLIFAFAFAPIAFALACFGAWVGRPAR